MHLLTRDFVLKAIDEYDRLGRVAFLTKNRFKKAREYFIEYEGIHYDCKPIWYAAFNLQYGVPPSRATSGTAKFIEPQLKALHFNVIKTVQPCAQT